MKEKYNDFLIITKFKSFIVLIESEYSNCPKKEAYLKDNLLLKLYNILEIMYVTNYKTQRLEYIDNLLVQLKIIDFMIKRSMDKGIISYKRFIFVGNLLNEIVRMCYGWMNSEKKKNIL